MSPICWNEKAAMSSRCWRISFPSGRELFEIWWYAYDGNNHILAKSKRYPTRLYFFLLEPGDLFAVNDFRIYLETGELKYPVATYYKKNGW